MVLRHQADYVKRMGEREERDRRRKVAASVDRTTPAVPSAVRSSAPMASASAAAAAMGPAAFSTPAVPVQRRALQARELSVPQAPSSVIAPVSSFGQPVAAKPRAPFALHMYARVLLGDEVIVDAYTYTCVGMRTWLQRLLLPPA
jgi:hypothetical protein